MIPSMSFTRRHWLAASACMAAAFATMAGPALAAGWPEPAKPVRIVVGFPPGGGVDTLARTIAPALAGHLGGTVIVDNRPGAGGLTATEAVAKSPADGYTLYMASPGSFTIWPNLRKLNYDAGRDFAAVSVLVTMPNLLITGTASPYKDVRGLIAAAKAPGAQLNYASGGVATMGHITAEQFKALADVQMLHVPYKGTTPALTDVMAGMVPITFSDPSAKPLIDAGKLRVLAVTTTKRSRLFPEVPTMAEAGVPGYDAMNWYGMVAPAGTPAEIVALLNGALQKIMAQPEVRERLERAGMEATSSTPEQFQNLMAGERAKWAALIRKAGIHAE